jgi:hypothetical protein
MRHRAQILVSSHPGHARLAPLEHVIERAVSVVQEQLVEQFVGFLPDSVFELAVLPAAREFELLTVAIRQAVEIDRRLASGALAGKLGLQLLDASFIQDPRFSPCAHEPGCLRVKLFYFLAEHSTLNFKRTVAGL